MKYKTLFIVFFICMLLIVPVYADNKETTSYNSDASTLTKIVHKPMERSPHPVKKIGTSNAIPVSSTNWCGYAVTGSSGSVTSVEGSWIVPTVTDTNAYRYSCNWIGIDGFNSNTVEQIGTSADTTGTNGATVYYAWYELYPKYPVNLNMVISPGDTMSAKVTFDKKQVTLYIKDESTGSTFTTTKPANGYQKSSAEWIAEAPSSRSGVLPLADFGTTYFGIPATSSFIPATCKATISGNTKTIGGFDIDPSPVQQITMVSKNNGGIKASPSALDSTGSAFSMEFKQAL